MTINNVVVFVLGLNYPVLEIIEDKGSSFWIVEKFEPSVTNGSSSVDYNYVKGINLDSFISGNPHLQNEKQFQEIFDKFIELNKNLTMKFSNNYKWKLYTK